MSDAEFTALLDLIQAHIVHARLVEGRQYDQPHMESRQKELRERIDEARKVLVAGHPEPAVSDPAT